MFWVLHDNKLILVHVCRDEVLFSYSGRIARRVDLRSLAPGVEVTVAVINVWSCILNYRERSKAPSAPARVFASPLTTVRLCACFFRVFLPS